MGGFLNKQQEQQLESCGNDEGASNEEIEQNPQISNNLTDNSEQIVMPVPSSGTSKGGRFRSLGSQESKKEEEISHTSFTG